VVDPLTNLISKQIIVEIAKILLRVYYVFLVVAVAAFVACACGDKHFSTNFMGRHNLEMINLNSTYKI